MGTTVTHAPATEDLTRDSEPRHGPVNSQSPAALKRRGRRENLAGYLFMSPWIAGFLLLTAGPMAASLYFAFTDYNLFDAPKWIGFDKLSGPVALVAGSEAAWVSSNDTALYGLAAIENLALLGDRMP